MMLRSFPNFKRSLAELGTTAVLRFAGPLSGVTVHGTVHSGLRLVGISSKHHTPPFGGQQASPSATLPVLFAPCAASLLRAIQVSRQVPQPLRMTSNRSTATNPINRRSALTFFNAISSLAVRQGGVLRSDISFTIQKGLAHV